MSSGFSTNIGIFFLNQVARLPFKLIYLLSDGLFLVVYYVIGYRKKVVLENLKNSFPEKSERKRKKIARKFFRHLSDIILETIKMYKMGEGDFLTRMNFKNPELVNKYFEEGKSVVVLTMHYNNWEWSSCVPLFVKHKILGVYKPLHNEKFDVFLNKMRARWGSELVPNASVLRRVILADKKNEPVFTWLAADQTPPVFHKFWMKFFNQEAMFYPGPASISKRFNYPVFFQRIEKLERGKYQSVFEQLVENPAEMSEQEIMKIYIQKMEEVIREKPEYYLWSHKRWKHKRPKNVPVFD